MVWELNKEDIYKLQLDITSETSSSLWEENNKQDYMMSLAYIAGVSHMTNAVLELLEEQGHKGFNLDGVIATLENQLEDCQNGAAGEFVRGWNNATKTAIETVKGGVINVVAKEGEIQK